jgi:hypothetical protein
MEVEYAINGDYEGIDPMIIEPETTVGDFKNMARELHPEMFSEDDVIFDGEGIEYPDTELVSNIVYVNMVEDINLITRKNTRIIVHVGDDIVTLDIDDEATVDDVMDTLEKMYPGIQEKTLVYDGLPLIRSPFYETSEISSFLLFGRKPKEFYIVRGDLSVIIKTDGDLDMPRSFAVFLNKKDTIRNLKDVILSEYPQLEHVSIYYGRRMLRDSQPIKKYFADDNWGWYIHHKILLNHLIIIMSYYDAYNCYYSDIR